MISRLWKKFLAVAWFLPGFLLWAAFPPMGEKMDVIFAIVPLMWLSRRADAKTNAKRWFQSGIFYWVATLSWMPAIVKNGGPWPLVVLGWAVLAAYCAAYFAAYGWLAAKAWAWARRKNEDVGEDVASGAPYWRRLVVIFLVEPVLWCGLELIRSRFFGGFAWNQLGVVLANTGFSLPASIGGVYLLSAIVILMSGTFVGIIERAWKPCESGFKNLRKFGSVETFAAAAVIVLIFWGADYLRPDRTMGEVKVALVQRNFPCCFSTERERENPIEVYERLLQNPAYMRPDLVVLPESAMCEFGPVDYSRAYGFAKWIINKIGAAVIAGGSRREDDKEYNSAALYQTNGTYQVYDKVHLVPFGEFIPGDKLITALQKLAPVGSCTPGELKTLEMEMPSKENSPATTIKLGVAICYEDTDSAQMRRLAEMGAQLLVFITNDSWFSHSIEAEQHAWQAVARAVETGLPVARVGNSGVTGTITYEGKASWLVDQNGRMLVDKPAAMCDRISVPATADYEKTIYTRVGDKPLAFLFLLLIMTMILVKYKDEYEKRRKLSM